MATTAKIAKDVKLDKARKAKTPKLQCRHRNRCWRCGRPRAFLRKFGICRLCFRKLALNGEIRSKRPARPKRPNFSAATATAAGDVEGPARSCASSEFAASASASSPSMARSDLKGPQGQNAQTSVQPPQPLLAMWKAPRVPAQVRNLPPLLPQARPQWRDPI